MHLAPSGAGNEARRNRAPTLMASTENVTDVKWTCAVEPVQLAAVLAGVILLASIVSVELGVTVALLELWLGVVAGNAFHLHSQEWLDFIASFASIVLTFLAGMEVDPDYLRNRAKSTVGPGVASFAGPFVVASLVAYLVLDWTGRAFLIAGTALSTTSLAVV
jgi:Kef-type K+ transport system membrane component KefB